LFFQIKYPNTLLIHHHFQIIKDLFFAYSNLNHNLIFYDLFILFMEKIFHFFNIFYQYSKYVFIQKQFLLQLCFFSLHKAYV